MRVVFLRHGKKRTRETESVRGPKKSKRRRQTHSIHQPALHSTPQGPGKKRNNGEAQTNFDLPHPQRPSALLPSGQQRLPSSCEDFKKKRLRLVMSGLD